MIDSIHNLDNLDVILRNMLLKQTELKNDRVLNSMSVRGVDLAKRFDKIRTSINLHDCFIVFHVESRFEDNDISMEEDDDSITAYQSYTLQVTIYGEASMQLGTMLKSRLETDKCRNELFEQSVYFERVTTLTETNEFLNETAWHRTDLEADFAVRETIEQVDKYEDFEELAPIISSY